MRLSTVEFSANLWGDTGDRAKTSGCGAMQFVPCLLTGFVLEAYNRGSHPTKKAPLQCALRFLSPDSLSL
jgi:hypothetical protein